MAKARKVLTKLELIAQLSSSTGSTRKDIIAVYASLDAIIERSSRGSGLFTPPGLAKLKVVRKAATKARRSGNPFTGEEIAFKAKPASNKVRILARKNFKGFVN